MLPLALALALAAAPPPAAERIDLGPLVLEVIDSETAHAFHLVDQLSAWSEFCHEQYGRWVAREAPLSDEERAVLTRHAQLRKGRGWGNGFEQALYTREPLDAALITAVEKGWLTEAEIAIERTVLERFAARARTLSALSVPRREATLRTLRSEAPRLMALLTQVARFAGQKTPVVVPVFIVASPERGATGGGMNGDRLVIEVDDRDDPVPMLLHEATHALLRAAQAQLQAHAQPQLGLDVETLNEAIAYALMPGLFPRTAERDELAESVVRDLSRGASLSNAYLRFRAVALVFRPVLADALERGESVEIFLPRAVNRWKRTLGRERLDFPERER